MPELNEDVEINQLVGALKKAAREHGTPNSFSPNELTKIYGCPLTCMRIGQLAQRCKRDIYEKLNLGGLTVRYTQQRFELNGAGEST